MRKERLNEALEYVTPSLTQIHAVIEYGFEISTGGELPGLGDGGELPFDD